MICPLVSDRVNWEIVPPPLPTHQVATALWNKEKDWGRFSAGDHRRARASVNTGRLTGKPVVGKEKVIYLTLYQCKALIMYPSFEWQRRGLAWHTVGQIPKKCKETSNLMWLSMIWFLSVLFVCWNLFCTIANLRIKCVTETKNASVLFYKNLKSSFFTWLTHLTLRFLYIVGCSGQRCAIAKIRS